MEYYTRELNNLKHRLKQAKEDLVKIKKDMDTFKGTPYYENVYKKYIKIMNSIKSTKKGLIDIQKNLDSWKKLNQKNL